VEFLSKLELSQRKKQVSSMTEVIAIIEFSKIDDNTISFDDSTIELYEI
jgi:hypothetical protein